MYFQYFSGVWRLKIGVGCVVFPGCSKIADVGDIRRRTDSRCDAGAGREFLIELLRGGCGMGEHGLGHLWRRFVQQPGENEKRRGECFPAEG